MFQIFFYKIKGGFSLVLSPLNKSKIETKLGNRERLIHPEVLPLYVKIKYLIFI